MVFPRYALNCCVAKATILDCSKNEGIKRNDCNGTKFLLNLGFEYEQ